MGIEAVKFDGIMMINSDNKDQFKEDLKFLLDRYSITDNSKSAIVAMKDLDVTKGSQLRGLYWGTLYKITENLNLAVIKISKSKKDDVSWNVLGVVATDDDIRKIKCADKEYISKDFVKDHSIIYSFDMEKRKTKIRLAINLDKIMDRSVRKNILPDTENYVELEELSSRVIANLYTGYVLSEQ